ncbi:uncharacterized protein LOC117237843 [Bombus vosnesenskii]|uniref:Uncharacterized protein LOC117237843 n=1 Tax=Bombus vosnesenskii TaxID=207650 RepID=A0A6J3KY90_9HYME|nr:uncharacterized protein LOC117237843 [Bombus vosnesenskii]
MTDYNAGKAGLTDEQVAQMQIPELKDELRRRRLRLVGRKRELIERLLAALRLEREHGAREDDPDDDNDSDLEDDDDDDEIVIRRPRQDEPKRTVLTFKDVEDLLEKFSGDDLLSINRWIEDFKEMAELCGWSDIHMVAFAKELLTGSAETFEQQEQCTESWAKLKKAMKDKFENVVSDQQIHRELARRTKKPDESLQQYMYSMREIAEQGKVDIQSQIDYIIQGIPDEVINKVILYGARNMQQLKECLKQYEAMKRDMEAEKRSGERKDDKGKRSKVRNQSRQTSSNKRCFNCGGEDHLSAKCPEKGKGVKCFKCNEFGHIAAKCTARPEVLRPFAERRGR